MRINNIIFQKLVSNFLMNGRKDSNINKISIINLERHFSKNFLFINKDKKNKIFKMDLKSRRMFIKYKNHQRKNLNLKLYLNQSQISAQKAGIDLRHRLNSLSNLKILIYYHLLR